MLVIGTIRSDAFDRGYLDALNKANVTPVWDNIAGFTSDHAITGKGETLRIAQQGQADDGNL